MLSQQSQLSHSLLTQLTQVIQYCYQRKSTAHMEHYVAISAGPKGYPAQKGELV